MAVNSSVYPDLERKPGGPDNWVEATGGLPDYIKRIAKHLHYEQGYTISHAIATAVNTVKRWAKGGTVRKNGGHKVTKATQATALKALAEWNTKKVKARVELALPRGGVSGKPRAFNEANRTRGTGGKFAPKGQVSVGGQTTAVNQVNANTPTLKESTTSAVNRQRMEGAMDQMAPNTEVALPIGGGRVRRLDNGKYQVTGPNGYKVIVSSASEALSKSAEIVRRSVEGRTHTVGKGKSL